MNPVLVPAIPPVHTLLKSNRPVDSSNASPGCSSIVNAPLVSRRSPMARTLARGHPHPLVRTRQLAQVRVFGDDCAGAGFDLGEAGVLDYREASVEQLGPVGWVGGADGQGEVGGGPFLAVDGCEGQPGQVGAMAYLSHGLAAGHLERRIDPDDWSVGMRYGGGLGLIEVGTGDLEFGEILRYGVQWDRREDADLSGAV